ncbi:MAG: anthranilate synthase component I family protein [Verrucomicrobiae bacterium]|nr:anthranilate synthase component I family protein [Verrucomicrobiae bacterium]
MDPVIPHSTRHTPESLAARFRGERDWMLLRSRCFEYPQARYSFLAARPFLTFRAYGSRGELGREGRVADVMFGNPWRMIEGLMARYELLDEIDLPFPLGGAFGFWGYDLRVYVEPRLRRGAAADLDLPDAWLGFYDSLVVFDHRVDRTYIVSTGLMPDGSRDPVRARQAAEAWRRHLDSEPAGEPVLESGSGRMEWPGGEVAVSNLDREGYVSRVERARRYIRSGDIYQVNLAQRWGAPLGEEGWVHWLRLAERSPSPFGAFLEAGDFALASVSPELFLKMSGRQVVTRPIKGTRPRAADPDLDARWTFDLQTSPKEVAELVMITDLLRNDLGRMCEYGTIRVPDLLRLERFSQVQHLVSTVEGRLRPEVTHLAALEHAFPGGSITGAPKIRAMEVIDELEPVGRGPYTGCGGYLGFNQESQVNLLIRTSVIENGRAWYHAGAGIVADSDAGAEYEETRIKARAFREVTGMDPVVRGPSWPAHGAGQR